MHQKQPPSQQNRPRPPVQSDVPQQYDTHALFDPGSTTSFLSTNMAILLHLSHTPATIHFSDGSQSSTSSLARVHFGNHSTTHTFAIRDHMPTPVTFGIDFWETHHMLSISRLNYMTDTVKDSMTEANYKRTGTTPGANQTHHDTPIPSTTRTPDEHTVTAPTQPSPPEKQTTHHS